MTIAALYKVKKSGGNPFNGSNNTDSQVHKIKVGTCTRVLLYFKTTPLRFLCLCCKSEKHALFEDVIEKGSEKIDDDFNLKMLIQANKTLKFQMEEMKKDFKIQDKPVFNEIDERNLIILDDEGKTENKVTQGKQETKVEEEQKEESLLNILQKSENEKEKTQLVGGVANLGI